MNRDFKQRVLTELRWALQALAMPPEVQHSLFPSFVCKAEELALEFDHWAEVALRCCVHDISDDQRSAVISVDSLLADLSRGGMRFDPGLWTDSAVTVRSEWAEVRSVALSALAVFGWPSDPPPVDRATYVRGKALRP